MKVALLSSTLDVRNGYGNITYELVTQLCAHGIDCTLFLPASEERFAKENPVPCPVRCVLPEYIYRIRQPRVLGYLTPLNLREFDVVHSLFDFPYCVYAAWSALVSRKRFVMGVQGTYGVVPLVYWPERYLLRWCYRRASVITVPSRFTQDMIERYAKATYSIRTIHNGVRFARFQVTGDVDAVRRRYGGKRLLLTVGGIKPRKGQDLVVRALPDILRHHPNTVYAVVGEGVWQPEVERLAEELGVRHAVDFVGPKSGQELVDWFHACDVYVHTPRVAHFQFEGFGIVYLEAGACGKPVIATDAGGIRDAVIDNETGLIVPDEDVGAIATAAARLLDDPALCMRLGEGGRAYAQRHDWSVIAEEFAAMYQEDKTPL